MIVQRQQALGNQALMHRLKSLSKNPTNLVRIEISFLEGNFIFFGIPGKFSILLGGEFGEQRPYEFEDCQSRIEKSPAPALTPEFSTILDLSFPL